MAKADEFEDFDVEIRVHPDDRNAYIRACFEGLPGQLNAFSKVGLVAFEGIPLVDDESVEQDQILVRLVLVDPKLEQNRQAEPDWNNKN